MVHPVQSVIESLYAAGRCPRLHVNATHAAVVCPEEIRHQWKERLIIDLDASYPLELTFNANGLAANLSFGGNVSRCSFPWEAIYVVMDRATGRGIVLDRHVPESVRRQSNPIPAAAAAQRLDGDPTDLTPEPRPELRAVADAPSDDSDDESVDNADTVADHVVGDISPREPSKAEPEKPATDESQVKKRRAAFRVIDGGG